MKNSASATNSFTQLSHKLVRGLRYFSHLDRHQPTRFRDNFDYGHFVRLNEVVKSHRHSLYLDNSDFSIHLQHVSHFLQGFCRIFCHWTVQFAVLYKAILRIYCNLSRQLHAMPCFHAKKNCRSIDETFKLL